MPWRLSRLHAAPRAQWRPSQDKFTTRQLRPGPRYRSTSSQHQIDNQTNQLNRPNYNPNNEESLSDLGHKIVSDYAHLRPKYEIPKLPIVLAHGLLGFDELHLLPGNFLPGIAYWRGIREAYESHGIPCITTAVPRTASISERAQVLMDQISSKLPTSKDGKGREVNIIAHSMGGLDARYMISRLCPSPDLFRIRSLTTIATPHRGSSAADMLFRDIGPDLLPHIYRLLSRMKIDYGAFSQLTTKYMYEHFNRVVPNHPEVKYFSYGASATPHLFSAFRISHGLMDVIEGPNDGLVSVRSSKWGEYRGTLMGITHLDLINWTNRIKLLAGRLGLIEQTFNAQAFYLAVAEGLAKEGF
ncbi:lipase 2 [Cladophialophora chaetospira]|uniref:Lipase 2 n=1 Tax=Cladophialophora chaetospira TaxID=386627 RepID=A0AA38XN57_9EURO|nr:lipase 2 [Cladophialophora chaetospira]